MLYFRDGEMFSGRREDGGRQTADRRRAGSYPAKMIEPRPTSSPAMSAAPKPMNDRNAGMAYSVGGTSSGRSAWGKASWMRLHPRSSA